MRNVHPICTSERQNAFSYRGPLTRDSVLGPAGGFAPDRRYMLALSARHEPPFYDEVYAYNDTIYNVDSNRPQNEIWRKTL